MQFIITQYLKQHLLHHRNKNNYVVVENKNGFTGLIRLYLCHVDGHQDVQCVFVRVSHSEATAEGIGSSSNSKL